MSNITSSNLQSIFGIKQALADSWVGPLGDAMDQYQINTPLRMAAFLAQVGHESARLTATVENLNYSAQALLSVFGKYFNNANVDAYARQPQLIASRVYANRMGNGNEASQEGWMYRGRGLIQITGKLNYVNFSNDQGQDFISQPDLVSTPAYAAMSAGWFWNTNHLNDLADTKDFTTITQRINGGQNGAADRVALYQSGLKYLVV